jgi:hypothetical protein
MLLSQAVMTLQPVSNALLVGTSTYWAVTKNQTVSTVLPVGTSILEEAMVALNVGQVDG